jgi:hypothetical protein
MKKHLQKQRTLIKSKFEKVKQLFFISIFSLICNLGYSQVTPSSESIYSPNGIFDKVFDKDNNVYNLSDITAGKSYVLRSGVTSTSTLLCTSGIFELYLKRVAVWKTPQF